MKFKRLLARLLKSKDSGVRMKFEYSEEEPKYVLAKKIYLIGTKPYFWAAMFLCPCGCNEVITLNLLKDASPRWEFKVRNGAISLYPSIWRKVRCKSHFHITKGRVRWSSI